jgi:hypothetical protein
MLEGASGSLQLYRLTGMAPKRAVPAVKCASLAQGLRVPG